MCTWSTRPFFKRLPGFHCSSLFYELCFCFEYYGGISHIWSHTDASERIDCKYFEPNTGAQHMVTPGHMLMYKNNRMYIDGKSWATFKEWMVSLNNARWIDLCHCCVKRALTDIWEFPNDCAYTAGSRSNNALPLTVVALMGTLTQPYTHTRFCLLLPDFTDS